jgi:hypothetical protein
MHLDDVLGPKDGYEKSNGEPNPVGCLSDWSDPRMFQISTASLYVIHGMKIRLFSALFLSNAPLRPELTLKTGV